jgi:nitrite reductase/ring-hydroxylating ferredoxin subunit
MTATGPGDAARLAAASAGGPGNWTLVCDGADLAEGGDGRRFEVMLGGAAQPAFVVRVGGEPRAYLNRCAHVPVELDWLPGKFLDDTGLYVICTVHGALYDAADGACAGGPCAGRGLVPVPCREQDGRIWVCAAVVSPAAPEGQSNRGAT